MNSYWDYILEKEKGWRHGLTRKGVCVDSPKALVMKYVMMLGAGQKLRDGIYGRLQTWKKSWTTLCLTMKLWVISYLTKINQIKTIECISDLDYFLVNFVNCAVYFLLVCNFSSCFNVVIYIHKISPFRPFHFHHIMKQTK